MNIWVDADACPAVIKEILFRAAQRTMAPVTLVANHSMAIPRSRYVKLLNVQQGFDVADDEIVKRVEEGDIVITADIPLASDVIDRGAYVLSPRGERYTANNIKARLNIRDFMEIMRASGVNTGGPPALGHGDRKNFADNLDKLLTRLVKK